MVDNNDDLLEDTEVYFGVNNKLKVRLRNRGNSDATGTISIQFWYQKATPYLTTTGWVPVQNLANVTQQITGASLAAGTENWFTVDWAPDNDGTDHRHWCVKVLVAVAGDTNIDNKMAFRNFSNVIPDPDGDYKDYSLLFRTVRFRNLEDVQIIPRGTNFSIELKNAKEIIQPSKQEVAFCNCDSKQIFQIPDDLTFGKLAVVKPKRLEVWDNKTSLKPNETQFYYTTDKRSLPPGVDEKNLVTIAQQVNGRVVGGVSYSIAPIE